MEIKFKPGSRKHLMFRIMVLKRDAKHLIDILDDLTVAPYWENEKGTLGDEAWKGLRELIELKTDEELNAKGLPWACCMGWVRDLSLLWEKEDLEELIDSSDLHSSSNIEYILEYKKKLNQRKKERLADEKLLSESPHKDLSRRIATLERDVLFLVDATLRFSDSTEPDIEILAEQAYDEISRLFAIKEQDEWDCDWMVDVMFSRAERLLNEIESMIEQREFS